jgi:type IV fimbrial biogenesis protein FimT
MDIRHASPAPMKPDRGFTLLELMVTIAVLAILLAIGVPTLTDFIRESRVVSAANELLFNLQLARSEAVKRRRVVCLRTADPDAPESCEPDPTTDGWSDAWLVMEPPSDTIRVTNVSDAVTVTPTPATGAIRFNPVGTVANNTAYTFLVEAGDSTRLVCLRVSGHSRVERETCAVGG